MHQTDYEIEMVAEELDNKYTIRSDIDIKPEGIEVTGGKYVKIKSGGVFDVDSANFKINSVEKYMQSGKWRFDDNGMLYDNSASNGGKFEIADFDDRSQNATGIYYDYFDSGNYKVGQIVLSVANKDTQQAEKNAIFKFGNQYNTDSQEFRKYLIPATESEDGFKSMIGSVQHPWWFGAIDCIVPPGNSATKFIGTSAYPYGFAYINNIYSTTEGDIGAFNLPFNALYAKKLKSVDEIIPLSGGTNKAIGQRTNKFSAVYADDLFGALNGGIKLTNPGSTDFNSIIDPKVCAVTVSSMTNKPTGLNGTGFLMVCSSGANMIVQVLFMYNAIYVRTKVSSSWDAWYKYAGTAV